MAGITCSQLFSKADFLRMDIQLSGAVSTDVSGSFAHGLGTNVSGIIAGFMPLDATAAVLAPTFQLLINSVNVTLSRAVSIASSLSASNLFHVTLSKVW